MEPVPTPPKDLIVTAESKAQDKGDDVPAKTPDTVAEKCDAVPGEMPVAIEGDPVPVQEPMPIASTGDIVPAHPLKKIKIADPLDSSDDEEGAVKFPDESATIEEPSSGL